MNHSKNNRMLMVFKSLANTNRLRILRLIYFSPERNLNVGDIYARMKITQPTVSNHLKLLRLTKIVRARQQGNEIYYSICDLLALEMVSRMDDDSKN